MERTPVMSSNVNSIGYDPKTFTLEVEFNSGDIYQYFNIPESLYLNLIKSQSKGSFINEHIKYSYRYQKIS